jgi:hypothetical protein
MRPLHGWQVTDPSTIYAVTAVTHEAGVHVGVRHPGASTRGDEGQTPDQPIPSTTAISDTAPDRHVLRGWLRQPTILCLCQEPLPRVVGDEMDREE